MRSLLLLLALAACDRADEERARIKPKNPPMPEASRAPTPAPTPPPGPTRTPTPTTTPPPTPSCAALSISASSGGVWIGDATTQRFAAGCKDGPDLAALGAEMCARRAVAPACSAVEVAATGLPYQTIIAIMDTAIATGLSDVGLSDPATLSVTFPSVVAPPQRLPAQCGVPASACPPTPVVVLTPPGPMGPPAPDLKHAPVVVIDAAGAITLDGKLVGVPDLEARLKARPRPAAPASGNALIVQADRDTPATLLNQVIHAAKTAGYDNLLFAVKNKP